MLEPKARLSWLNRTCGDDAAMASEVASLLAADADSGTRLENTIGAAVGLLQETAPPTSPTQTQAAPRGYRVERHLGFGGTSTVVLALNPEGQRVALKVVRPELAPRVAGQFVAEQRLLQRLRHPGIARLLDAGTLDNGLPYVATEYVPGESLDRALEGQGRKKILEVFIEVCDAVQHAHRNLIIHRDLKPANILATEDLQPKLLDFGLARLLEPDPSRPPTATAHRMLTPSCASPEQLRGEALTTATDIYSLGVLLYTLLAGSHPHQRWLTSPGDFARAIQDEEPPPPSQIAGRARNRGLDADLDAIVLKALRKDPVQRYGSVERLQEDLRRALEGRPVTARRGTLSYRARRFVRRHRVAAAAGGVVVVLFVAAAAALWQQQRHTARAQERAQRSLEILVDLLGAADPRQAGAEPLSARTLLDHTAARLEEDLADQPEVRSLLLDAVGTLYLRIGALGEAETLLEEALRLHRSGADLETEAVARILRHRGEIEDLQGDYRAAEAFFRQAVDLRWGVSTKVSENLAASLNGLADSLHGQSRFAEARSLYEEALKLRSELYGGEHRAVAETLNHLAVLEHEQGQEERAENLYRKALAMRRRLLGSEAPEVAESLNNLAALLREQGRLEEGEVLLEEAVELEQKLFGEDSPQLIVGFQNLGLLYLRRGNLAQA